MAENSIELDKHNQNILRELFNDGRTPISEVSRKVRLSKEVVNYRIKKMSEKGFLKGFNTVIDIKKLGFHMFLAYLKLENLNIEREEKIINALKEHPNIAWIIRCIGPYDFVLKLFVKNYEDGSSIIKEIESEYLLQSYVIDYILEEHAVPLTFIYASKKESFVFEHSKPIPINLEPVDFKILQKLSNNARMPISEMAKELSTTREIIRHHLKKLEKNKIILKYRPSIRTPMLGYNWYVVTLKFFKKSKEKESHLKTYLINCPHVTYFYMTLGSVDMPVEIRVKTTDELHKIIMDIRSILQDELRAHELLIILNEYKYTYFTRCLTEYQ